MITMTPEFFFAVDKEVLAQTLSESVIQSEISLGNGVTVLHGTREGAPIAMIENGNGEFSGVWFDEDWQG
jgi:hypothetical protein